MKHGMPALRSERILEVRMLRYPLALIATMMLRDATLITMQSQCQKMQMLNFRFHFEGALYYKEIFF